MDTPPNKLPNVQQPKVKLNSHSVGRFGEREREREKMRWRI